METSENADYLPIISITTSENRIDIHILMFINFKLAINLYIMKYTRAWKITNYIFNK